MRVSYSYPTEYIYQYTINGNVYTKRTMFRIDFRKTLAEMRKQYGEGDYSIRLLATVKGNSIYRLSDEARYCRPTI